MELHRAGEDYLKAVLILQKQSGSARSKDISDLLRVSRASVSNAMKLLRDGGFVTIDPKKRIRLTDVSREIAERVLERHSVVSAFLRSLGVAPDVADADACRMEHIISTQSFECMRDRLR